MFLRIVKTKYKKTNGVREWSSLIKKKENLNLVAHLGRVDLIPKGGLTKLAKKLARFEGNELYAKGDLEAKEASIFGPIIVIRKGFRKNNKKNL